MTCIELGVVGQRWWWKCKCRRGWWGGRWGNRRGWWEWQEWKVRNLDVPMV